MSLQNNVTKWLDIDNQIREQSEIIKRLKLEKNILEEDIFEYASENKLNNVSIKTNSGNLKLFDLKTSSPLSFKYIEKCLSEIFDNNKVSEIINYLKDKRTYSVTKSIKRLE